MSRPDTGPTRGDTGLRLSPPPHGAQHPLEGFEPPGAERGPPPSANEAPVGQPRAGRPPVPSSSSRVDTQAMAPAPGRQAKPSAVLPTGHRDRADGVCGTQPQGECPQFWSQPCPGRRQLGARTDRQTNAHLQRRRRWEARLSANLLRARPAHQRSVPQDGQTCSSSPGLVQSPEQGTAARHVLAKPGTCSRAGCRSHGGPSVPTRPSLQHSGHRMWIWASTAPLQPPPSPAKPLQLFLRIWGVESHR